MGAGHDHADHADHAGPGHGDHVGPGHGSHGHGVSADADRRWLSIALALILGFMAVEVVIGLLADSLALLSDAAHMLTDAAAIVLALVAMRLAARPPRGGYTYGLKRAEILSAQANGITLLLLAAWLGYEAIARLIHPPDVRGGAVLITAIAGIGVNLVATWCLSRANRSSLNIEGAFQHILNDLFAFIATAIAGLIVLTTGFNRADGIASLVVVGLMVKAGLELLAASGRILLEAAPAGLSPDALGAELARVNGVVEVHDLHVWQVTSGYPALSAHILVQPHGDCHAVRREVEGLLRGEHHIAHTTLQVDHTDEHDTPAAIAAAHCADPHGAVYRPPHA